MINRTHIAMRVHEERAYPRNCRVSQVARPPASLAPYCPAQARSVDACSADSECCSIISSTPATARSSVSVPAWTCLRISSARRMSGPRSREAAAAVVVDASGSLPAKDNESFSFSLPFTAPCSVSPCSVDEAGELGRRSGPSPAWTSSSERLRAAYFLRRSSAQASWRSRDWMRASASFMVEGDDEVMLSDAAARFE